MTAESNRIRPQDLLRVTAHHSGGAVVLAVTGEVDLLSAPMLGDGVTTALADAPELLVIDLSEVSFLASIGITVLLEARRQAGTGTRIRVVAPEDGVVNRTLRLTGLHEALAVTTTRDDALG
ncbi:STAS domain-containing protein [Amycolatopsis sp. DG1A-15b]|uniref:STAS domain-containing protein n=1 Tax=Amycolatopsis sp. DG1A-15b TaxID=3052846 RepID=UPI00255B8904|nr:STAS domain-containing protein [Amycolatopsis sp. DG1A-15b]WIX84816.1 STAS domain-containing protein [Amycolatopsis sp. DG1A-15b]